ncbi:MAG: PD40 domain-containing protein [Planctomycetales bacterium]|nr:PD40 domain-containing protein [Planctomycetales bacterium]
MSIRQHLASWPNLFASVVVLLGGFANADEIRLAGNPAVSPNGRQIAFDYGGDIWLAPIGGGRAQRVTFDETREFDPHFSPDGKQLAFISDRHGANHAYTMTLAELSPQQVTFHSEGCDLQGWPSADQLLVSGQRDHHWRHAERFWHVALGKSSPEHPLFDAYGSDGSLSRDGRHLLFVREGERWWRQGYEGARAAQIWRFDVETGKFTKLVHGKFDSRWPIWRPDGRAFYYVTGDADGFDLYLQEVDRKTGDVAGEPVKLLDMGHGSITFPSISRSGRVMVFSHLGELYRVSLGNDALQPEKVQLLANGESPSAGRVRRTLNKATEVEFSHDGLEVAMIAGGDVWLMDTVLREPVQITDTPQDESNLIFDTSHRRLYMVREDEGQTDIWSVERADASRHWWQNRSFKFRRVTNDLAAESFLRLSPDGKSLLYVRDRGDLWIRGLDGGDPRQLISGFDRPDFDVSPDGKWLAYSQSDNDFNRDVWIAPMDGSTAPFNVSRHPDDDFGPRWSPDGRLLAFIGNRQHDSESDIHYVWLQAAEEDVTSRDRKLQSALAKMGPRGGKSPASSSAKRTLELEGLHQRIHGVSIPGVSESSLTWSPDSQRLAFSATVKGVRGIHAITIPTGLSPTVLTTSEGSISRWLKNGTLLMLSSGVPTTIGAKGEKASLPFQVMQQFERSERNRAAFDVCWRTMRDHWYDPNLGNRDWAEVRRIYGELAARAPDPYALRTAIELMLGELNGSHLGFYPVVSRTASPAWTDQTPHLGVRFDLSYPGPGLRVRDVILNGPCDVENGPRQGDLIREIDGVAIDRDVNLARRLNGVLERDIQLTIERPAAKPPAFDPKSQLPPWEGHEPGVAPVRNKLAIRPVSYSAARDALYEMWLEHNRATVEKLSHGKLGYLHIRAMNLSSFTEFERQLYYVGYAKDGLVIDVRENGGGSTTDLLLTALTQPRHAVTVPRGGGPGYPQSRMVYATWHKPILVMCNQNSYSNAEIFSHAIKGLKRGRLVGVPTAGGVVSTGMVQVMDVGSLRFPFRGWYVGETGQDMELNGAVPDVVIWPEPGELPQGVDRQLDKAVQLLMEDVEKWDRRPTPKLQRATERGRKPGQVQQPVDADRANAG